MWRRGDAAADVLHVAPVARPSLCVPIGNESARPEDADSYRDPVRCRKQLMAVGLNR